MFETPFEFLLWQGQMLRRERDPAKCEAETFAAVKANAEAWNDEAKARQPGTRSWPWWRYLAPDQPRVVRVIVWQFGRRWGAKESEAACLARMGLLDKAELELWWAGKLPAEAPPTCLDEVLNDPATTTVTVRWDADGNPHVGDEGLDDSERKRGQEHIEAFLATERGY